MRRSRVTLATMEAAATAAVHDEITHQDPAAADQGLVGHCTGAQRETVDEDRSVDRPEPRQRPIEGEQVADMQPTTVDRRRRTGHDREAPGPGHDLAKDLGAPFARELFGVVEGVEDGVVVGGPGGVVKHDRRRHEGTRQTAASGFVGAGHATTAAPFEVVGEARVHGGHGSMAAILGARAAQSERMREIGQ